MYQITENLTRFSSTMFQIIVIPCLRLFTRSLRSPSRRFQNIQDDECCECCTTVSSCLDLAHANFPTLLLVVYIIQVLLNKLHNHLPSLWCFGLSLFHGPLGINQLPILANENVKVSRSVIIFHPNNFNLIGKGLFQKKLFERKIVPPVALEVKETYE